jgi:hypothetical protein
MVGAGPPSTPCARHGTDLGGKSPTGRLAGTVSQGQLRHREVESGGSRRQTSELTNRFRAGVGIVGFRPTSAQDGEARRLHRLDPARYQQRQALPPARQREAAWHRGSCGRLAIACLEQQHRDSGRYGIAQQGGWQGQPQADGEGAVRDTEGEDRRTGRRSPWPAARSRRQYRGRPPFAPIRCRRWSPPRHGNRCHGHRRKAGSEDPTVAGAPRQ